MKIETQELKINKPQLWLIGIGGTNASGKDTLANFLVKKYSYLFVSTSDMIREEAMKREGNILRPTLVKIGNALRAENGPGILVQKCIEKYKQSGKNNGLVVSSIRTKGEVDELKKQDGVLLFTNANPKIRYQRIKERQREDDFITYQEFLNQQQAEWHQSDNPAEFSIKTVKQMADHTITNDTDLDSFFASAKKALFS